MIALFPGAAELLVGRKHSTAKEILGVKYLLSRGSSLILDG
jgi:hypothetical protein